MMKRIFLLTAMFAAGIATLNSCNDETKVDPPPPLDNSIAAYVAGIYTVDCTMTNTGEPEPDEPAKPGSGQLKLTKFSDGEVLITIYDVTAPKASRETAPSPNVFTLSSVKVPVTGTVGDAAINYSGKFTVSADELGEKEVSGTIKATVKVASGGTREAVKLGRLIDATVSFQENDVNYTFTAGSKVPQ